MSSKRDVSALKINNNKKKRSPGDAPPGGGRFMGFRTDSKIIIATVNILLVGVKWDIKAINHCLSVLISVREISEIGSHKSWPGDSTLRLHSSWRYRFIVLKTHSGE